MLAVFPAGGAYAQAPAPTITSVAITSSPDNAKFYLAGERIEITVGFSAPVQVTGSPMLSINVEGMEKGTAFESIQGSQLVFSYTVTDDALDVNGVGIGANSLTLGVGSSITGAGGTAAYIAHDAVPDDGAPSLRVSPSEVTVEEGGSGSYTVALGTEPSGAVRVTITGAAGMSVSLGGDALTFTPSDWNVPQTVTVTGPAQDDLFEADETVTLVHSAAGGGYGGLSASVEVTVTDDDVAVPALVLWGTVVMLHNRVNAVATGDRGDGTIADDDPEPSLTVADASATEGGTVTFTVTLTPVSDRSVTVDWAASDDTATSGDYTSASGTLAFAAGETSKTVTVRTTGDRVDEEDEAFTVTLSNPGNAVIGDASATGTITDDDTRGITIVPPPSAIDEGGSATYTVVLASQPTATVTVTIGGHAGTDISLSGTTLSNNELTFTTSNWGTAQTVTVNAADDDDAIADAAVTLTHTSSGGDYGPVGAVGVTVAVTENDTATLSVADAEASEGDANAAVEFEVTLSVASSNAVTVDYATSDGTAKAGADFTATSGSLTFPAGSTVSQTVRVPVTSDTLDEDNETFTLTLSNPGNAGFPGDGTTLAVAGTITDDDHEPGTVSGEGLTIGDASASEGGSLTFTVSLTPVSGRAVTVDWATLDGTAKSADYTAASGSLTFAAGDTTKTVTVSTTDDTLDEDDETLTVTLSNPGNALIGDTNATGTIEDDDEPRSGQGLSVADASADEDAGTLTFTVRLGAASGRTVTVDWATGNGGTAAAGADYTAANGSLSFAPGDTSKSFTVSVLNDALDEDDETFAVALSNAANASIDDAGGTGTILDDDDIPGTVPGEGLTIADASATEGGSLAFTVSVTPVSGRAVTVDWATSDGTAKSADYTAASGSLTFAAGDTTKTVTVSTTEDTLYEEDETFTVTLSNSGNALIGDGTATGTIEDDDEPSSRQGLSVADASADEDAGTLTFTVRLGAASGRTVTVDWATGNGGTAAAGDDYTAANGSLSFAPGDTSESFTVSVLNDALDEDDETFAVALSNAANASIDDAGGTGTILDDDDIPGTVSGEGLTIADASAAEGGSLAFTVSLTPVSGRAVTVDYATSNGTAVAGTDYTAASGSVTLAAGDITKTVTVATTEDTLDEDDETFTVTLSNPGNALLGDATGTGTITDGDDPVSVTVAFGQTDYRVDEGSTVSVAVNLSAAPRREVVIPLTATNQGGAGSGDYSGVPAILTFGAAETSKSIAFAATDDTQDDDGESVVLGLGMLPAGVSPGSPATATVTIADDDGTPSSLTVSFEKDTHPTVEGAGGAGVTLILSAPADEAITLPVSVSLASTAGVDDFEVSLDGTFGHATFFKVAPGGTFDVTFEAGEDSTSFFVRARHDGAVEGEEWVDLGLGSLPAGVSAGNPAVAKVTFTDGRDVSFGAASYTAMEGGREAMVVVRLDAAPGREVVIHLTVADGAGVSGGDYSGVPSSVTFGAAETSKTFMVRAIADGDEESGESVVLSFRSMPAAIRAVDPSSTTVHLRDASALTAAIGPDKITEDGKRPSDETAKVTVSTNGATFATDQTIALSFAGTATPGADYAVEPETLVLPAGESTVTATVTALTDDNDLEATETIEISVSHDGEEISAGTVWISPCGDTGWQFQRITVEGYRDTSPFVAVNGPVTLRVCFCEPIEELIPQPYTSMDPEVRGSPEYLQMAAGRNMAIEGNQDPDYVGGTLSNPREIVPGQIWLVDLAAEKTGKVMVVLFNSRIRPLDGTTDNTYRHSAFLDVTMATSGSAAARGVATEPLPALSVADATVRERPGASVEFRVSLSRAASGTVTVDYATSNGTATAGKDYTAASGTLRFGPGETSKTIAVSVLEDAHDEGHETLTLRLSNASGARISGATATGTIENSESMPQAWLSRFGRAASDHVVQAIEARWRDGSPQTPQTHLTLGGGQVHGVKSLFGGWDGIGAAFNPSAGEAGNPALTDESTLARMDQLKAESLASGSIAGSSLAGGNLAGSSLTDGGFAGGGLSGSRSAGRSPGGGGLTGESFAGRSPAGRSPERSALMNRLGLPTDDLRDVLMGSSFFYSRPLDEHGGQPDQPGWLGQWSAWGETAATRFSGAHGPLSLDGEVATAMLGVDSRRGRWLAGVTLAHSEGDGAYTHPAAGGGVTSRLTSLNPYVHFRLNKHTNLWGVVGYGVGGLTLTPESAESGIETDLATAMAAFGGRGVLSVRSGRAGAFELAIVSDALVTNTVSEATENLMGAAGQSRRLRLMLKGSGSMPLGTGGMLKPTLEAGLRYDAGDAETGAGLEIGGGLGYATGRLEVEVNARALLAHEDTEYEEWGFSGSIRYRPSTDGRGLSMNLGSTWGNARSGVQSLWSVQDASGRARGAAMNAAQRFQVELGYGIAGRKALAGGKADALWVPFLGAETADGGARSLRMGFKLTSGPKQRCFSPRSRPANGSGSHHARWSATEGRARARCFTALAGMCAISKRTWTPGPRRGGGSRLETKATHVGRRRDGTPGDRRGGRPGTGKVRGGLCGRPD